MKSKSVKKKAIKDGLTYFPHRHQSVSEKVDVNLAWHLGGLLHVDIEVEEVLEGGHAAEGLELVSERGWLCGDSASAGGALFWSGLRAHSSDALMSLDLLLRIERCLPLIVPELPSRL